MFGIRACDACSRGERGAVEHLADVDAAADELVASRLDVGGDQLQALGGAGRGRSDPVAEADRAAGAGRRELDYAEARRPW